MKLQSLVQLTGVFLVAASSTSFAQCETKEMSENFAYVAKGGVGTICTTDYEQSRKFCIAGGKIETYKWLIPLNLGDLPVV